MQLDFLEYEYVPAAQFVQAVAPADEYFPDQHDAEQIDVLPVNEE